MHFPTHEQKQALLEQVLRLADQRLAAAGREGSPGVHLALLRQRRSRRSVRTGRPRISTARPWRTSPSRARSRPGQPKIRVYNPRVEEHGWTSPHTVIEVVNDDMPFLVDSVTMEVNRQGYTLHLFNHPIFATKRDAGGPPRIVRRAGEGRQARVADARRGRSRDRSRAPEGAGAGSPRGAGRRARVLRRLGRDARPHGSDREGAGEPAGVPQGRGDRRRFARSSPGPRTTISRSSGTATTTWRT